MSNKKQLTNCTGTNASSVARQLYTSMSNTQSCSQCHTSRVHYLSNSFMLWCRKRSFSLDIGSSLDLFSSKMFPYPEKSLSEYTELAGVDNRHEFFASTYRCGN